ncbi:MAG: transketolase [Eubacteriales bacterium]
MDSNKSINSIKEIMKLKEISRKIRKKTIKLAYVSEYAHPGPSLSITDILTVLYYQFLNINPKEPQWLLRDRLVLSKGHGCLSLYAILSDLGFYPEEDSFKLRKLDSIVQGHPDMKRTPGIDFTTGSLGNGISAALGIAISLKVSKLSSRVYAIIGDGEMNEGIVWEAASFASCRNLDNLTVIVDNNNFQGSGCVKDINCFEPIDLKWEAFGWNTIVTNGHDIRKLIDSINKAISLKGKPTVIIAHTIKGRGISFMENNNMWHQHTLTIEQYQRCIKELSEISEGDSNE